MNIPFKALPEEELTKSQIEARDKLRTIKLRSSQNVTLLDYSIILGAFPYVYSYVKTGDWVWDLSPILRTVYVLLVGFIIGKMYTIWAQKKYTKL